ncbi:MAG: EAL domain-containing protein [Sphingomonadaceae bacterium]|nr:EAL domain-containing protein [Sphingomonadaceae bacterium]
MLRSIYGAETATAFALALAQRIETGLVDVGAVARVNSDADSIWVGFPPDPSVRERLPAIIDDLLLMLGSYPVIVGETSLLAAVSVSVETGEPEPRRQPSSAPMGDWRTKADMRVAVTTFEAIAEGRLYFLFQSIAGVLDPGLTLYQECFTRIVDRTTDEELQTPRGFIPALERLGLTRRFDRAVIEGGIAFLLANPTARIGCNISALSAVDDAWWTPVLDRLAAAPDIASRLVVELTETTPRGDIAPILEVVRAFRRAGCRIAIDNFGAGFSGLRFAVAAAPDIIKIDACYVREQAAEAFGATYLGHLVGLAGCLATDVVVVGIENDADLVRAREAAADWVQGRYVAPAALSRTAISSAWKPAAADGRAQRPGPSIASAAIRERTAQWARQSRTADEQPWASGTSAATPGEVAE